MFSKREGGGEFLFLLWNFCFQRASLSSSSLSERQPRSDSGVDSAGGRRTMQHARGGVKRGAGLGCDLAVAASVARAGQGLICGVIPRWGAAKDPAQGRREITQGRSKQHRDFAGGAGQWLRIPAAHPGGHGLRAQCKPGALGHLAWNLLPCGTRLQSSSAPEAANRDSQPPPVTEEIPDGASSVEEAHEILFFSLRHAATVTIKEMHAFGQQKSNKRATLLAAQFLHEELPIRIARRVRELTKLPHDLGKMPSIIEVRKLYEKSFFQIRKCPKPKTNEQEEKFTKILDDIMVAHNSVQHIVASGLQELFCHVAEQSQKGDHGLFNPSASYDFGQFLDRFYLSRVGMRVLVGQHIMLHHPQEGFIGIIQSECQPAVVCKHAVDDATSICMHSYGMAPEVKLLGATGMKLPYIPEHLHYIFFELLKNSMRAVVERHGESGALPPIEVVFAEGKEDIAIKISDKGGGIPRSGMSRLWSYSFTTAGGTAEKIAQSRAGENRPVMAGFAHGLPLSRIHARAFGGDVQVMSLEGHGTDVYVYLWKLGDIAVPVP